MQKLFPKEVREIRHISGKGFPSVKYFPFGKGFLGEKHFQIWKCLQVGKGFPLGMHFPTGRHFPTGKHFPRTTIWRNPSQKHQNKETIPEGNLLEFCEIFTPACDRKFLPVKGGFLL
jgi:hypothetical protein